MTKMQYLIVLSISYSILLAVAWSVGDTPKGENLTATSTIVVEEKEVLQTEAREAWLVLLIECESSGNPNAINEIDRDGTPSYGLLQFKPSTFEMFSKAYGVEGELMDPEAQKRIVRKMMDDPSVRWETQFPDCVRKRGQPPS